MQLVVALADELRAPSSNGKYSKRVAGEVMSHMKYILYKVDDVMSRLGTPGQIMSG
jgi:hypothetical protein